MPTAVIFYSKSFSEREALKLPIHESQLFRNYQQLVGRWEDPSGQLVSRLVAFNSTAHNQVHNWVQG